MKKYIVALTIVFIAALITKTLGLRPNTPQGDAAPLTPNREIELCSISYESFEGGLGGTFSKVPPKVSNEVSHAILHVPHEVFLFSTAHPRVYEVDGHIYAGVVPHHITAASMISGFFGAAAAFVDEYDLVVIVAPNHEGDFAPVILSCRGWDVGGGVFSHCGFVEDMLAAPGIDAAVSHAHMQNDHAAGIFIPYIYYYLPGVKVAPVLLNRSLSFEETIIIYEWLENWIAASGLNVLLVASVDFSHFLTPSLAVERDRVTTAAILAHELEKIHTLSDHYLDSPAAMIIFLKYLEARGLRPQIVDRACAAEFLGAGLDETTSYKIIIGAREEKTTRLTFVGDIMLHEAQLQSCFDRAFALVAPHLQSADLAIGNLETTFSGFFSCFPLFSAPDEFGYALKRAGFGLLSTANNHSLDQGVDGLLRTLDFLDSLGIATVGTYRNQTERDTILIREINGIRFAFLAYTFSAGANSPPFGREYLVNLMHTGLMQADIKKARALADIVIVTPHMGNEYELFVRQEFKDVAMLMLQAGADVVIAGHPHVVQPMGFVQIEENGTTRQGFIAYCLGNFISSQREPPTETGVILNLYFEKTENGAILADASYIPTWVKFTNTAGQPYIQILPLPIANETNLRHQDQIRVREAYPEIAEIIPNINSNILLP
ncbi:MAG: AmmeMemoRadiSam system protein B [Defluviitaleaceae bacterium]|nr:AmmeMemoRadiSam system protein B [Defluviitaleaceae bacterium]